VQSGGTDTLNQRLYLESMRALESELIRTVPDGVDSDTGKEREHITFVAEKHGTTLTGKMDHLVCFVPVRNTSTRTAQCTAHPPDSAGAL